MLEEKITHSKKFLMFPLLFEIKSKRLSADFVEQCGDSPAQLEL